MLWSQGQLAKIDRVELGSSGADVVQFELKHLEEGERTGVDFANRASSDCRTVDAASRSVEQRCLEVTLEAFERIDALVNNVPSLFDRASSI